MTAGTNEADKTSIEIRRRVELLDAFAADLREYFDANLYWQTESVLVRASEHGIVTPIVGLAGTAEAVAIDHDFVYWLENSTIYYAPKDPP
jgi:hypothetical protein